MMEQVSERHADAAGTRGQARVPPVFLAAFAQVAALVACLVALPGQLAGDLLFLLAEGLVAATTALLLGLAPWWLAIEFLLPFAVRHCSALAITPHWFLAAFVLMAGFYWSTHRTQVPLYLSNRRAIEALKAMLPSRGGIRFLDVGCGTASVLAPLSRVEDGSVYHGVELAPLTFGVAWLRAVRSGGRFSVRRQDLWSVDLSTYDVVYAFLSPVPMAALWKKVVAEMRPGTLLVSNTFIVPGLSPDQSISCGPGGRALHVWRVPGTP